MPIQFPRKAAVYLTAGILLAGCASNPTGGTNVVFMSESGEVDLGKKMHDDILSNMPIYRDPELESYINQVGQSLVQHSHRPDIKYTFTIIDSPDINAFAAPGGYVYINRGILLYLTTEDQLAAVLGHEIAHITDRHAVQQDAANKGKGIFSTTVAVVSTLFTGVNLGSISDLYLSTWVSGYGREMELRADELGAEYLYKTGYDPMAMVDVITVLKNQEDFSKLTSQQGPVYHGLFSTHPRNDVRLYQAVSRAGDLKDASKQSGSSPEYRNALEGLPVGQTRQSVSSQDRNRYYQDQLIYTLVFPDNWTWEETTTTVTATSPDGNATLKVEARRRSEESEPRTFLLDVLGITTVNNGADINQFGLKGYTGLLPDTGDRVAVIFYGSRAYIFRGHVDAKAEEIQSENIQTSIGSFRPIARNELAIANPPSLRYVQVGEGTTYAQLARGSKLGQYAEDMLRLFNGDYPKGEPEAGEWIKVVD